MRLTFIHHACTPWYHGTLFHPSVCPHAPPHPAQAASRCKADIPTGCLHGSCGVCEVELHRYKDAQGGPVDGGPVVVRACIAKVPRGWGRVEVGMMADDQVWGQDGWDT